MKKDEIKIDLRMYKKLKNELYYKKILEAYEVFDTLFIKTKTDYYSYQINWAKNPFKDITYEEMLSFKRLRNFGYYTDIETLYDQISNKSKIITFPKYIN